MTNNPNEPEFILNKWAFGENGAVMNVAEIKKRRDEASTEVLTILKSLEMATGMKVSMIDVDCEYDHENRNCGVESSKVELVLE